MFEPCREMKGSDIAQERYEWIDLIKGLSVMGIIAVHFSQFWLWDKPEYIDIFQYGQYCVQIFFVISGFLGFESICKNYDGYFRFIKKSIIRLMPICYLSYSLQLVMSIRGGISLSPIPIITAYTFTNGIFLIGYNAFGNWYIGTLICFYLILPILRKVINSFAKASLLFYSSLFICIVSNRILSMHIDTGWNYYFWLPRQFPLLALGIILKFIKEKRNDKHLLYFNSFLLAIVFWGLTYNDLPNKHIIFGIIGYFLVMFSFGVSKLKYTFLSYIGRNSLGIYLFHPIILKIYFDLFHFFGVYISPEKINIMFIINYIAVVLLCTMICGIISCKYEKPIQGFLIRKAGV